VSGEFGMDCTIQFDSIRLDGIYIVIFELDI